MIRSRARTLRGSMIRGSMTCGSMTRGLGLALGVALFAAAGCKKEAPPAETKTEAEATTEKKDAPRSRHRNPDEGVEVPTEEDFEVEVEKQITTASDLSKELDLLEKQILGK